MSVFISKQLKVPNLGKRASDYAVGDTVLIPVNEIEQEFLVIQQGNPDSNIYDASCNGTWLLAKYLNMSQKFWNNGTGEYNDYENSTIHSYLNTTMYNYLSEPAKRAIKQVKIPYRPGYGENTDANYGTFGLSTKVFLLSGEEVGLKYWDGTSTLYMPVNEGSLLSYFTSGSAGNSKRAATVGGSMAGIWSLRSPYCDNTNRNWQVSATGDKTHYYCGELSYPRYAFIINSSTKFDPDTNVIIG